MNSPTLPTFKELQLSLNKTALKLHPSQAHGVICGMISGSATSTTGWETLITGDQETTEENTLLQQIYECSAAQLADLNFSFQLLLPADSQNLPIRAEALSMWCQGFLTGLKIVNVPLTERKPSELTEAIHDLIEIAKMNYEEVVANEEDETAYVELVEYVRMAAILIYEDLHEVQQQAHSQSDRLH